jgi:hypothetical protein
MADVPRVFAEFDGTVTFRRRRSRVIDPGQCSQTK